MKGEKMRCTSSSGRPTRFPLSLPQLAGLLREMAVPIVGSIVPRVEPGPRGEVTGGGHSRIFHVTNEPRMHRCSLATVVVVAVAGSCNLFLLCTRSFYLFVSVRLDENAKCRTKHASSVLSPAEGGRGEKIANAAEERL